MQRRGDAVFVSFLRKIFFDTEGSSEQMNK